MAGKLRNTKKKITCSVTINDKTQNITINSDSGSIITQAISDKTAHTKRSCDSALIVDTNVTYTPDSLSDLL